MKGGEDQGELTRAVRAADVPLDEVARLRMKARILSAAGGGSRRQTRFRMMMTTRRIHLALAGLVILGPVVAALVLVVRMRGAERGPAPAAVAAVPARSLPGQAPSVSHLEVPAGATIHTVLAGRARVTLTGPAEVDVVSSAAELVEVRLPVGVLVGDYDHRAGGILRIISPGATTDVVGTLFAVEASAAGSRISVVHGRVRVRSAVQEVAEVAGGQSWSSQRPVLSPMLPEVRRLFGQEPAVSAPVTPAADGRRVAPGVSAPVKLARLERARGDGRTRHTRKAAPRPAITPAPPTMITPVSSPPTATAQPRTVASAEPPLSRTAQPRSVASAEPPSLLTAASGSAVPPAEAPVRSGSGSAPSTAVPDPAPAPASLAAAAAGPVRAEDSSEALYTRAERAMKRGDLRAARAALESLVREAPGPATASARYELGRLALRMGDRDAAARVLDELLASGGGALRGPAQFLRCRVEVDRGGPAASVCFRRFLAEYPGSIHAPAARRLLAEEPPR